MHAIMTILKKKRMLGAVIARSVIQRRRHIFSLLLCALSASVREIGSRMPTLNRLPPRTVEDIVSPLTEKTRERLLRMRWVDYLHLCSLLQSSNEEGDDHLCTNLKLDVYITLRWLAGASYLDIATSTRLPISTMYVRIDRMIHIIDSTLPLSFPCGIDEVLNNNSDGFSRGRSPLKGCVGALDGLAIKIREPNSNDVPNPSVYYNRKGFFAMNMQGMCDHRLRFTFVSIVTPGSSHDSMAYQLSSLYEFLNKESGSLPDGMWVAGDAAYVCSSRLLTPWSGKNLPAHKDCFNYWLSSARVHIEQAFGVLVGRWGILWRSLRVSVDKASQIALVCCKLHNFIIERTQSCNMASNDPSDVTGHEMEVHLQDECVPDEQGRRRDLERSDLRELLTNNLKEMGMKRP